MAKPPVTVVEPRSGCVVLHVQPQRFDDASLQSMKVETVAAGLATPTLPIVVDLGKVGVLPSFALGGLVELTQSFRARGQRLILANLHPYIRETVSLSGLDKVFEIVDDLSSFAKSLSR